MRKQTAEKLCNVISIMFFVCISVGKVLVQKDISTGEIVLLVLIGIIAGYLGGVLFRNLIHKMNYRDGKGRHEKFDIGFWVIGWIWLFFSYIPVWLAFYPGIAAYDANIQVMYVMENKMSTHHPISHTLFLGGLFKLGTQLKTASMGIDWYCLLQMIIMSAVFSYVVTWLKQKGIGKVKCLFIACFYALFPINSMLAISTTKDTIFAASVILFVVLNIDIMEEDMQIGKKKMFSYILISVFMLLMRNNALYALIVAVPIMICLVKRKKRFVALHVIIIVGYFICNAGLIQLTDAEKSSPIELLSVPVQQMARVGYLHDEVLENSSLKKYIPETTIAQYNPYLADKIKFYMNADNVRNDKIGFIKEWISLGLQYPKDYIDAFLYNSMGFWYICDTSHSDIYGRKNEGYGYLMDDRLSYDGKEIGQEQSYLPGLKNLYHQIWVENEYQNIPVLNLLCAPAFWIWTLVFSGVIIYVKKQYSSLVPICFLGMYYVSLLFGPCCLIRYIYPIMVCVPIFVAGIKRKE